MRPPTIVIALTALLFAGFVIFSLLDVEPVHIENAKLEMAGGGEFLTGIERNTGASSATIDLEVRYFDSRGHQVGTETRPGRRA
jgi:hypothetical protein